MLDGCHCQIWEGHYPGACVCQQCPTGHRDGRGGASDHTHTHTQSSNKKHTAEVVRHTCTHKCPINLLYTTFSNIWSLQAEGVSRGRWGLCCSSLCSPHCSMTHHLHSPPRPSPISHHPCPPAPTVPLSR